MLGLEVGGELSAWQGRTLDLKNLRALFQCAGTWRKSTWVGHDIQREWRHR